MAPIARFRVRHASTGKRLGRSSRALIYLASTTGLLTLPWNAVAQSLEDLQRMSIEDLANIEISSVSKGAEPLSDASAAIYVITHEDIVRSGARSVPEILRLAPNLQVAAITASSYAISARGFNGVAASKLLVLIDGRSVYTPFFSGVFWDVQEVPPEDIDRIEVISGPGATLWGANAVNGVINIVTRGTSQTQGGSAEIGGGNLEQKAVLQYGGKLGDAVSYRAYVDAYYHDDNVTATGANARDNMNRFQGGFRFDWTPSADLVTVQGDFYKGSEAQGIQPNLADSGRNLLARWTHKMDGGSALQIQAYYDYAQRSSPTAFGEYLDTYDLDLQHSFSWGSRQQIVWGGGYRVEKDNFPTVISKIQQVFFVPQSRTLGLGNIFVQDSISLLNSLKLVLGTKLEHDPYSGLEPLPSARVSWKVTGTDLLWTAVSRAVRAPSRLDRDLYTTVGRTPVIHGDDFQPEKLIAYELGYRAQPMPNASISASAFYNVYQDLRSAELSPNHRPPIVFGNDLEGDTYGIELWGTYGIADWWRLSAGFNWLHKNLHFKPGSSRLTGISIAGDDPTYQFSIRSTVNPVRDVAVDFDLRKVGTLPSPASPSYVELGGRVGWTASEFLEVSITGTNLLHPHHLEFGTTTAPLQLGATGVETGRSVFVDTRWKF